MLARTEVSLRLKRTELIVSVEVGKVRLETGRLLKGDELRNGHFSGTYFVSSQI
jgi:hypothetical protein